MVNLVSDIKFVLRIVLFFKINLEIIGTHHLTLFNLIIVTQIVADMEQ